MNIKKFRLLEDRFGNRAGTVVYDFMMHDYGLSNDDARATGEEHTSVTLDEKGGYPSFTVPMRILEVIQ